jgi:hypothetical protein
MKLRVGRGWLVVLCAFLLGLVAAGGVVYATIPDPSGTIHGCYNTSTAHDLPLGVLRVIDTGKGQVCSPNEKPLNWSQSGGVPGDTIYPGGATVNGCTDNVVASKTITVPANTRIFASGQANVYMFGTHSSVDLQVRLYDSAGTTQLASNEDAVQAQSDQAYVSTTGVLYAGGACRSYPPRPARISSSSSSI